MAVSTSSKALRPLACFAALNASCQGVVGVVLSVLALTVCFCGLGQEPQASDNSFAQYITYYLQGDECSSNGTDYQLYQRVTSPTALRVWVTLSLFFSASMMISSEILVMAVVRRWSDEKLQITLVSWLFINTFTAIDDLILGYLFSSDFSKALNDADTQDTVGPLALAVISFLVLRGGYLWLLNVALILYLTYEARGLHMYINEQLPKRRSRSQLAHGSWPTLDDFGNGKSKEASIDRDTLTPTAINPRLAERVANGHASEFPEHTAMARWPTLNGQAHTMRESRGSESGEEVMRERRSKTLREASFRRQQGEDNLAYESDRYFMRLQSETESAKDFEEYPPPRRDRSRDAEEFQGSRSWELPRRQDREIQPWQLKENDKERQPSKIPKRETREDSGFGQFRQRPQDPWRERTIPAPPTEEYGGVPIPPVDYIDQEPSSTTSQDDNRPYSLQEAILDRTLRLKKVPEELRKGFK